MIIYLHTYEKHVLMYLFFTILYPTLAFKPR